MPPPIASDEGAPVDDGRKVALVIDDSRVMRMLLKTWLRHLGFAVTEAPSSIDALGLVARTRFDLVLCDVNMPGPSGFAVLEQLKKDGANTATPFVFLTTLGKDGDIRRGLALGADGYLTKPLTWGRLKGVVLELVR